MADSAADVPNKYDCLINGFGYCFARDSESPFLSRHARYGQTPTFVERSNTSGNYGDNQQDFWMVLSQHDFSGGEGQRYIDVNTATSTSKVWRMTGLDGFTVPGHATPRQSASTSLGTLSDTVVATAAGNAVNGALGSKLWAAGVTNLYYYNIATGAFTSVGAHSATAQAPGRVYGMVTYTDSVSFKDIVLLQRTKYDENAGTFSTFLDTAPGALCFHNNILYGFDGGTLRSYDTSGVSTIVYPFKDAVGNTATSRDIPGQMVSYGGVLAFLSASRTDTLRTELWFYDGTNTTVGLRLPADCVAFGLAENNGLLYIGGGQMRPKDTSSHYSYRPTIWVYDGSTFQVAWQASARGTAAGTYRAPGGCAMLTAYKDGIAFVDFTSRRLMYMNALGAVCGLYSSSLFGDETTQTLVSSGNGYVGVATGTTFSAYSAPGAGYGTQTLQTSLFDGGSSLPKYWKSVRVDVDIPNGTSVDIAYQLDSVDGSYTTLQTGITSGTEYALGQSAHSISIQLTVNTNLTYSATSLPTIKRIYVRGVPIQDTFRRAEYILDLSGNKKADPANYITLRNGQPHTLDGDEMRANLVTAIQSTTPISITDRFGTFTGIIEPDSAVFEEIRADYGRAEYKALVTVRQT